MAHQKVDGMVRKLVALMVGPMEQSSADLTVDSLAENLVDCWVVL